MSTYVTDGSVFMIAAVPLQLSGTSTNKNYNFWINPSPFLTHMYRSIKFVFAKETGTNIVADINGVTREIKNLLPLSLTINDCHI